MTMTQCWIAFLALLRKEVHRFLRLWLQTILPPVITMSLYFIIFGTLIGSQIHPIQGYTYMQYITPGLVMMSVITNAYLNTVSSVYLLRFQKSIEELLVSPMPNFIIVLAFVLGGILRGMVVGILVLLVSLFFTRLDIQHVFIMFLVGFMAAAIFSLAGFINGMYARNFDDISIIPTFVLTPLTYLGGVFYSVKILPSFWQHVSLFNPILYIVNIFRYGILGLSDIPIKTGLLIMIICVIGLFWISLTLLEKGTGVRT